MKTIVNVLGFKLSWWACVLGAVNGLKYLGPVAMLIFLILHLYLNSTNRSELKLIIIFAFVGTIIDTLMAYSNLIGYVGLYSEDIIIAPLWITAMWCGFSALVNHSLAWLKDKWSLAFLFGAIGGPLAYIGGEKLGAIYFNGGFFEILVMLGVVWGVSIPFIYWVNDRLGLGNK